MDRAGRIGVALGLAVLVAAPAAWAGDEVGLGPLLAPGFDAIDDGISLLEPLAPGSVVQVGRLVVSALRAVANATVVGAGDGDAGSSLGTPEAVGVQSPERTVVDGVRVPGQEARVEGRRVDVGTPAVNQTIRTPPVGVPAQSVEVPAQRVALDTPPLGVPAIDVTTPPVNVTTPRVATPPLRVATPAVRVPNQSADVDVSRADVTVQRLHGTVYAGPAGSVPFEVGPLTAGASSLPPEVPRRITVTTPGVDVLPETVLVDEPSREVLAAQHVEHPSETVHRDAVPLLPGQHLGEVEVPGVHAATQAVPLLGPRDVGVSAPAQHLASAETSGLVVRTDAVDVTDERVVVPGVDEEVETPLPVDDLGYVGYGTDDDSSLYPYACTAVAGCMRTEPSLRPYVHYVDAHLDNVAAMLDGSVVVRPPL